MEESLREIVGDVDDVNHVSRTSVSGVTSLDEHLGHFFFSSNLGSTGNSLFSGRMTSPQLLQYQTGIDIPIILCLDMHQSHFRPFTQFS